MFNRLDAFVRSVVYVLVRVYQRAVSPLLGSCCRFEPSCSQYALEALQRCSVGRALWLIVRRLVRCQPFCRGGVDPVPPDPVPGGRCILKGEWLPRWSGEAGSLSAGESNEPGGRMTARIRGRGTQCSHG